MTCTPPLAMTMLSREIKSVPLPKHYVNNEIYPEIVEYYIILSFSSAVVSSVR